MPSTLARSDVGLLATSGGFLIAVRLERPLFRQSNLPPMVPAPEEAALVERLADLAEFATKPNRVVTNPRLQMIVDHPQRSVVRSDLPAQRTEPPGIRDQPSDHGADPAAHDGYEPRRHPPGFSRRGRTTCPRSIHTPESRSGRGRESC